MKNRDFSTVQSSKQIERKVMKKAKKQWVVKGLLFSTILGSSLLLSNVETFAQETQKEWQPRTSEQIKSEIKGNEYIIQWGDTLSAISVATDISINRLAEINQIANIDLIYAGNKLVFGGEINSKTGEDNRVVAVQDSNGKTSVVINTDENKPLVNQKETKKAKETENNGGTYTPPKVDNNNNGNKPLPEVPTVPKPKPEEPVPPVKPVDPVKPTDPEPPIDPVDPGKTEADKTQLTALYNSTIDYKSTDYAENSWLQFKNTRNEAKTVLDNKEATQSEVDNMTTKLQSAINGLAPITTPETVDKSALTDLYNSTINYVSTDYETTSWNSFKEAREASLLVINNPDATQAEVDGSLIGLQAGIDQLVVIETVDKTNLLSLVEDVKDYQENDYTSESWSVFYNSFVSATDVLANENATQEEVDSAYKNLSQSISSLEKVKEVNKQDLINLYNSTASLNPDDYTEKSYNDFILAKSDAKSVIDNPNATVDEVNKAQQSLQQAIDSLEKVAIVDKTKLIELYDSTASLNPDDYTEKSYNDFILAKSDAKSVIDNPNATEVEVNKAQQNLQQAIDSLEKVVVADKTKLIELYDSTASLNPNDYTEDSWNNFILAKSEAKSVIDNPKSSQSEVDNSFKQLEEAKNKLEKKNSNWDDLELGVPTYSAEMTQQFENAINSYRQSNGVFTLPISDVAREKSNATASQNVSSDWTEWTAAHGGQQVGTTWGSTTFYSESDAIQKAMNNFDNSPGHKANLLENDPNFAECLGGSVYIMKSVDKTTGATMYSYLFIGTIYSW
ncbi:LysM peptidoglycan-binding domain-containing protein [uncultured Vagococcus sp.]|uniref:LysM peptidoglycan-binding domain-containing protein n=1 Tax=uncultured Vagococcus sp. TaxID=189676 RepID=UPI00258317E0|nr:LysM peptidoglycan-binding domain-containing protein [uncultured Vagococcus sp.]